MKRYVLSILSLFMVLPLMAQLYHPGEVLEYRVSYKARMFPNTEVGSVKVTTTMAQTEDGEDKFRVEGVGRTLPTYRWFFNMEDIYTIWVNPQSLRTEKFVSDIREGDYTFVSDYVYDWHQGVVRTHWQSRKQPEERRTMALDSVSMDPISLFFNMRSAQAEDFTVGEPRMLQMVLQDTIRPLRYRYLGRETKRIRNMGRYHTLKFECELGSSEGFSFTDGTIFTIWISDDENKIPLYIESPVKIGCIQGYISRYRGLKYPVKSKIK